jgi:hypothetical protein
MGSCRKYSAVTRTQTRLLTIAKPHPAASIVDLTARRQFELPIGTDNEDLLCGTCGMVVLSGWSVSSTGKRLVVDAQLLIRCGTCRTYNVVPAARLAEQRQPALALVDNRLRGLYISASTTIAVAGDRERANMSCQRGSTTREGFLSHINAIDLCNTPTI